MDSGNEKAQVKRWTLKRTIALILTLVLAIQVISGVSAAAKVAYAMMRRDVCYLAVGGDVGKLQYPCDNIVYYSPENYYRDIMAYFNRVDELQPGERIVAIVIPMITVYGSDAKRVWLWYSNIVLDEDGEIIDGIFSVPVKIDYRWDRGWKVDDIESYGLNGILDGETEFPVRDWLRAVFVLKA